VIKGAVLLLALTAVAAVSTQMFHPRAPLWYEVQEPPVEGELTVAEVQQRWHGEVLWVDARMREAFDKAHVPSAILINEQELDALLLEHIEVLQDNRKPIVVYCDGHACKASHKMRRYLMEHLGFMDIYVLKGGFPAWQAAQVER
jgi:rhodanese-related sulfurtransferase